ncbi:MAG TPA: alpha/beta fold hydrolase [archaeon]|nr:alpha/beta fold hydrolase [archaeon]
MTKSLILILLITILITGCTSQQTQNNVTIQNQTIENFLSAADGTKIAYTYYDNPSGKAIILLHILGGSKADWLGFAELIKNNYAAIAIDFRGHGDSEGSKKEYQKYVLDVDAAKRFLQQKGKSEFIIIGASIGANVALNYAAENNVSTIVLLSPSLDYRGVATQGSIQIYSGRLLIISSAEDTQSFGPSQQLYAMSKANKQFIPSQNAGHGTDMVARDDIRGFVFNWLVAEQKKSDEIIVNQSIGAIKTMKTVEFNITAKQFEFVPSTIEANEGETVALNIKSVDVTHGFNLADFGINEQISPGKTTTVSFNATKKGTFSFFCNIPCGTGHPGMRGQLIIK